MDSTPIATYDSQNIKALCDFLGNVDSDLKKIIELHGYPVVGARRSGFEALVRLILEQQVSLMSARAAYLKLQGKIKTIIPTAILGLTDEELRQCYFSRQKSQYVRALAQVVIDKQLNMDALVSLGDNEIRKELIQIKGIGMWTADNYLLLCLRRTDIFPIGDIALVNSIKKIKKLSTGVKPEKILHMAETWRPYRSIAAQLFWHAYIIDRKIDAVALQY